MMQAMGFDESELYAPGDQIVCVDTDCGRLGLMVCYDLRFPEMATKLVTAGADVLVVSAQFPVGDSSPSRKKHWDILCQSTALQNSTYVVACNQSGDEKEGPMGRSCVVDPWGKVITRAANVGREFLRAQLDFQWQREIRSKLNLQDNRRPDVYSQSVKWYGEK
jgi:predicted amidohydrolase